MATDTTKPAWDTVAIVGVGLIGGSLGLALRQRGLAREVIGIGRRAETLREARERGCVTQISTDVARGVAEARLIILCTPVETIGSLTRLVAENCPEEAILTDVGSTKEQLVAEAEAALAPLTEVVHFVGSHPLAGSEKTGAAHARADLFQGRAAIVTPTPNSHAGALVEVRKLWEALGARVFEMTPVAHDEAVASISHLPHLLASALAAATPEEFLPLVAGGWIDTTRIAAGDPELWRQILSANRGHTLRALEQFGKVLEAFRAALAQDDADQLLRLLQSGKSRRDALGN
jgi:prephenate dehydrogenase